MFKTKNIGYCEALVKIFINNDNNIFGEFCVIIIGYYSQRGSELFFKKNENKYSKYILEQALSINEKYSLQNRIKNNIKLINELLPILNESLGTSFESVVLIMFIPEISISSDITVPSLM